MFNVLQESSSKDSPTTSNRKVAQILAVILIGKYKYSNHLLLLLLKR